MIKDGSAGKSIDRHWAVRLKLRLLRGQDSHVVLCCAGDRMMMPALSVRSYGLVCLGKGKTVRGGIRK